MTTAPPRLLRDSTLYFLGNVAGRAIGLAMIPFYARFLSPGQYGVLNLIELASGIVAIAFGLQSIAESLSRIYHDQTSDAARKKVISSALIFYAIAGSMLAMLAACFAGPIATALNLPGQTALLQAGFAGMFFGYLQEIALVHERIEGRAMVFLIYTLLNTLLTVALNIWFIGFLHFGVWGFISSKLLISGMGSLFLVARTLWLVGVAIDQKLIRDLLRFAGPLVISSASFFTIHFSDRVFLAHIGQAEVGVYSLAYNFALLLSIVVGDSFAKFWDVSLFRYAKAADWQADFIRIGRYFVLAAAIGGTGIALFAHDALRILVPASYWPPLLMIPVLVLAYFFREAGDFFRNILLIEISSSLVGAIGFCCAALNLTCNALLIPRHGIWGAAIATLLSWGVYFAVCWALARRVHRVIFPISAIATVVAVAFGAVGLSTWLHSGGIIEALTVDGAVFAVFLAVLFAFYLDRREQGQLQAAISR